MVVEMNFLTKLYKKATFMGAQKKHIFDHRTIRNAELGLVVSASARILILQYLDNNLFINIPILERLIPLHQKTINHHVSLIERAGLIQGQYIGNMYFWSKNEKLKEDWEKIRWAFS
jgi:predicted transcriptional regulator